MVYKTLSGKNLYLSKILKESCLAVERQWSKKQIESVRQTELNDILNIAFTKVPYYKNKFLSYDVKRQNINSIKNLSKLPILTKQNLLDNFIKLIPDGINIKNCVINKTSGSSGIPTKTLHHETHYLTYDVSTIRMRLAAAIPFGEKVLYVVPKNFRLSKTVHGKENYPLIDTTGFNKVGELHPTEASIDEITFNLFKNDPPTAIYGNPYLIKYLSEKIFKHGVKINIPYLITSFELTSESDKRFFKKAFNCKIFDIYGFSEMGDIAWECTYKQGYHINDDYFIVEGVDDDGNSIEEGEANLVVTSLVHKSMPLIRYMPGDKVWLSKEQCKCGRKLSIIKKILGRKVDFIKLPNGDRVSPYSVIQCFLDVKGINWFKLIQAEINQINIQIVKGINFDF